MGETSLILIEILPGQSANAGKAGAKDRNRGFPTRGGTQDCARIVHKRILPTPLF